MYQYIYKIFGHYLRVLLHHNRFGIFCLLMAAAFALSCKEDHQAIAHREPQKATAAVSNAPESGLQKYVLDELDNTAGLSNSSVNCIFQDSQNLIWIGTWDGLNRYDGSSFKIFRPQPNNSNSLSNQVVLEVAEDSHGQIWVLTMHGINRYDKTTDTFHQYFYSVDSAPPLSESHFKLALNNEKDVFCAVKDWGIGWFDGSEFKPLKAGSLKNKTIRKFDFAKNGKLVALTEDNDLYVLDIRKSANGAMEAISSKKVLGNIKTFEILPNQNICMVATDGSAYTLTQDLAARHDIANTVETVIGHTAGEIILIGSKGYLVTDLTGNSVQRPWSEALSKYKVTSIIKGSEDILWMGTDGDGIVKASPQERLFKTISKTQLPEMDGAIVRSFLKDDDNTFWVGTKGKGLFHITSGLYNDVTAPMQYIVFNEGNSPLDNAVYALYKGKDNLIFIGTDDAGLSVYDGNAKRAIGWKEIEGCSACDYFKSVYAIHQDEDKNIWLGTNGYGMIKLNIERHGPKLKVTGYKKYSAKSGSSDALGSNIIFSILPKNNKELWVGTRLGGLNLFDTATEKFRTFKNKAGDAGSLSNNDILSLNLDNTGKLWIGTSYGLSTLQNFDGNTAEFKNYSVNDGLPNNTIHGILPDKNNNLWLSTNFGLSAFNAERKKFTNYVKGDGLQNNEFADGAFYSDTKTGYIFMGGIKGFNYFLPQTIKESSVLPDLFIDRISGHNQPVPFYQGLLVSPDSDNAPALTLKHNQNFLDIHLAALTFTNNEKCRYAYQLKGFDKNWNPIDNRKIISFTNVPPGNYSLYMKWSNSDGVWTNPVHTADIKINPVWWQSNPALVLYTVLGLGFLWFVRSYYLKKQSLQQNILFRQREEELHENRLTFFTNIAHEFLTPLTLIAGPVQKLFEAENLDDRSRKFIKMIQRNASRLSFLTQQLLEFRKAEHDHLEVRVRQFDLVGILEQIAELFDDWALDKNIDYKLELPNRIEGWFDKEKIEKILFNLLSNAFKYTPNDGKISLAFDIDHKAGTLKIVVTNNGKGIPKEKLELLFDRFFLSDPNQVSDTEMFRTGIGLAYVKRLVTVLRGEILVSSIPDKETTFTILIPCEKEAFTEKEIDNSSVSGLISRHLKDILEEPAPVQESVPGKISALEKAEDRRKKLLIVEDEREIHTYLKDLLGEKYSLAFALNGAEALQMAEKALPDLIISDVMMPVMDGVEFCRIIKTDVRTCHIPFIMLTAKSSVEHRIEGLESGANSYIPKPFYPDHLMVRIQKLLEEKELILKHFAQDNLVESLPEMNISNDEKAFIKAVIDIIRKNIDSDDLDSAFIEKTMGISNSQLYRKTKEFFNLSPGDLVRTVRLKYAAELLRKNVLTVSEVCYKSGFNNRSYFYREFKKVYDTTPKNYQLNFKAKKETFNYN